MFTTITRWPHGYCRGSSPKMLDLVEKMLGNSADKHHHTRSVAYTVVTVLLNKHQISYLHYYQMLFHPWVNFPDSTGPMIFILGSIGDWTEPSANHLHKNCCLLPKDTETYTYQSALLRQSTATLRESKYLTHSTRLDWAAACSGRFPSLFEISRSASLHSANTDTCP